MKSIDYSPIIFLFMEFKPHIELHYWLGKKNRLGCRKRTEFKGRGFKSPEVGCYFIRNKAGGIRGNGEASGQSCWNYYEISVFGGAQGQPGDGERCTQMLLGCRGIYHADSYAALFDTSFTPG